MIRLRDKDPENKNDRMRPEEVMWRVEETTEEAKNERSMSTQTYRNILGGCVHLFHHIFLGRCSRLCYVFCPLQLSSQIGHFLNLSL